MSGGAGPAQARTAPKPAARCPVLLSDYRPPEYRVERISLWFDLAIESTEVEAQLHVRRATQAPPGPLQLDGERPKDAITTDVLTAVGRLL